MSRRRSCAGRRLFLSCECSRCLYRSCWTPVPAWMNKCCYPNKQPWILLRGSDPGDVAEVVSFDSRVEVLQPMTGDRTLLEAAIQRMRASGSTALYNAVYIVLRQLDKVRPQSGDDVRRQVIVVLSDGEDTSSLVTFDDLLDSAKRSQTVIYTVGLGLGRQAEDNTFSNGEYRSSTTRPGNRRAHVYAQTVRWISSMSTR